MAGAHEENEEGKGEEEDSQGPEEGLGLIQTPQHCLCDVVCYVDFLQCAWSQGMDKALVNCLLMVGPSAFELDSYQPCCSFQGIARLSGWQERQQQRAKQRPRVARVLASFWAALPCEAPVVMCEARRIPRSQKRAWGTNGAAL